uniref:Uncharacterized protein n=1 Tax=Ditylenchus dipsaci TaxID=166011 RepID=A0A915DY23_9BILA
MFRPTHFQVNHASKPANQVIYKVVQAPSNGIKLFSTSTDPPASSQPLLEFSQAMVNKGSIGVEHIPLSDHDKMDVVGLEVEGTTRVLLVSIEPLALHLFNHSEILFEQGRLTWCSISNSHLGAESNGERSRIFYNITKAPENGSFYWVAGEKEANWFTQKNVDDGDVLYAQLNMNAFKDSFSFVLGNDEMELLQKSSSIRILPAIQAQPLLTHPRTITQISLVHLNVSSLDGSSPRFLVITPPQLGRLFLHPQPNHSAVFFTHSDIQEGRLFFHAFELQHPSNQRVVEQIELELRSDSVQPARFLWPIDIRPEEGEDAGMVNPGSRNQPSNQQPDGPRLAAPPDLDYRFPVAILAIVVLSISGMLFCHRRGGSKTGDDGSGRHIPGIAGHRPLPDLDDVVGPHLRFQASSSSSSGGVRNKTLGGGLTATKSNESSLLDSTVYASIGRQPHKGKSDTTTAASKAGILAQTSQKPSIAGAIRRPILPGGSAIPTPVAAAVSAAPVVPSTFATFETTPSEQVKRMPPITIALPRQQQHNYRQLAVAAAAAAASRTEGREKRGSSSSSNSRGEQDKAIDRQGGEDRSQVTPANIVAQPKLKNAIVNPARLKENQYWV